MTALFPKPRHLALIQSRRALVLWAVALLLILMLPAGAVPQRVQLGERFYLIDLPARPQGAPLILALHGGGGDPAQFASASGLGRTATAKGYAVVFPAGSSRRGGDRLLTWNGGYCCGYAARAAVDDAGFLAAVIADATARFGLDGAQVFLTGMSNGAIMAETFAARNPRLVTAVAGVAGTMDTARTRIAGHMPALIIHGTADAMVPFSGGVGADSLTRTDFSSVDQVVQAFLAAQPGTLTKTTRKIDRHDDGTSVTVTDWSKGGKVRVRLIAIDGGAHHWPGGRKARMSGGKTQEIDANAEILRFFDQYR
jgi:polyhydroxybutyrate depolymerase